MPDTEVLIIGAGPTGLVLALWLTKAGVKVRIVDKAEGPGTTSRALVIHARSLEFYYMLGIAHFVLEKGAEIKALSLWARGKKAGRIAFSELHANISPYQSIYSWPQDEQEKMLEEQLAKIGINVERKTELISFEQAEGQIKAELLKSNGEKETCSAKYLAGCDGARSTVREGIGVGFPGGTYNEVFYVADIRATGPLEQNEVNIAVDEADFLAVFPISSSGTIRLVGSIRQDTAKDEQLNWDDVSEGIINRLKIEVEEVRWFSTYRVHHRVASHFKKVNAFLLGDAGHIHSPVGGQGMNTGIGDAVNLAWKIAAVIKENAPEKILDTYEPERIAFARQLVATTDKAFSFVTSRGYFSTLIRLYIAPPFLQWLFNRVPIRRFMFRTVSQTLISYRQSILSEGSAGKVKAGDRLPWVTENGEDNFNSLNMHWQVHIYGISTDPVRSLCNSKGITLNEFAWTEAANKAGLKRDAVYVIRPDGHVGFAGLQVAQDKLEAYLNKWNVVS
jgi:2-polyprenyl-6-methoxyphenol hydroxylase-like FAD-dependent oxidoreductase